MDCEEIQSQAMATSDPTSTIDSTPIADTVDNQLEAGGGGGVVRGGEASGEGVDVGGDVVGVDVGGEGVGVDVGGGRGGGGEEGSHNNQAEMQSVQTYEVVGDVEYESNNAKTSQEQNEALSGLSID